MNGHSYFANYPTRPKCPLDAAWHLNIKVTACRNAILKNSHKKHFLLCVCGDHLDHDFV